MDSAGLQSQIHLGCSPGPISFAIPAPMGLQSRPPWRSNPKPIRLQPQTHFGSNPRPLMATAPFPRALHPHPFAPPAAKPSSPPRHHIPMTPINLFNPIAGCVFPQEWILRCLLLGLSFLKTSRHVMGEGGQEEKGSTPYPVRDQGRNGAASRSLSALEGKTKGSARPSPPAAQPGPPCARPAAHRKFLGVFGHSSSSAYF